MRKFYFVCLLGLSCCSLAFAQADAADTLLPIEKRFPLKWERRIGTTTFRTNLIFAGGYVIAPSNGTSRNNLLDNLDGVHILDPMTGEIVQQLKPSLSGDSDVNGVAFTDGRLYFGNDEGVVVCYQLDGTELWRVELGGDIEGSPVLTDINKDGTPDCIVATEDPAAVVALDGLKGTQLWKFEPKDYGTFMASPAAYDMNADGVDDIFIGLAGSRVFYAISGSNGRQMWRYQTVAKTEVVDGSAVHASATVYVEEGKKPLITFAEVYGTIHYVDGIGRADRFVLGPQGMFSSPVFSPKGTIIVGGAWQGGGKINLADVGPETHWRTGTYGTRTVIWEFYKNYKATGPVSASGFVADLMGTGETWQLGIPTEAGELHLYDERGNPLPGYQLTLPAGAEASCLVQDIDGDGKLELLVATLDGYLRCYQTEGAATRVFWGQLRGENTNRGVYRKPKP